MIRLHALHLAIGASLVIALPAQAQHHGHMPGMTMPMPKKAVPGRTATKKAAPKKTAVTKPPVRKKAAAKKAPPVRKSMPNAPPAVDPHAGHDMSAMPAVDPHAGHDMSATPAADPHAGHSPSATGKAAPSGTDLPAGDAPPPPIPAGRAADAVYGAAAMEMSQHHLDTMHGAQKFGQVMLDIGEFRARRGRNGHAWEAEAWYGGDLNRLLIKSEGEGDASRAVERAELQLLYSRALDPYFNLQGGVRVDVRPRPSRAYVALGVEGLAPGFFDVEGAIFLSNKGEVTARAEGYYDQRITQRLILQPRAEVELSAQRSRDIRQGRGLTEAELGLRLRYDIRREFSPYVGLQYERAFGDTRALRRQMGENAGGLSLLVGLRTWF